MTMRAKDGFWWPKLGKELEKVRENCKQCRMDAPSQPKAPPTEMMEVLYPFQQICGDFFDVDGRSYLVLVDRFSGWPVVAHMQKTMSSELIKVVKEMFMTFGILEVFTSDGGTNFISRV